MATTIRSRVILASLTLTFLACEQSVTSVADPVVEFEAAPSVARVTHGRCYEPGADLRSWWPGDDPLADHFNDIADISDGFAPNHITTASTSGGYAGTVPGAIGSAAGVAGQAFSFTPSTGHPAGEFLEVSDPTGLDLKPEEFTIAL